MVAKKGVFWPVLLLATAAIFVFLLVRNGVGMREYQQYSYLSQSFLQGKLYFTESYSSWWHDAVEFSGKHYWPLGVLPAVILIPFSLLFNNYNLFFYQGYLQIFLVLMVFIVLARIAQKLDFSKVDSVFLAFGFVAASC